MTAAMNIPAMLAEAKRLQAIENRRTLVRAWTAMHEVFAEYSRQGRLLIVPPLGKIVPCFDTRTTTGRLLMLARCGMITTADAYAREWFRDGRPARSKARRKFKGHMLTNRRQARDLVKPADRRARHVSP
ncbi:MAG TPA: hypothetical protein VK196_00215 [Magnetospirillum sp.]|nr:hypothetical protein [Magnetospirillum sp.]